MFSINNLINLKPIVVLTQFITNKLSPTQDQNNNIDLELGIDQEQEENNHLDTNYTVVVFDLHEYLASLV